MPPFSRWWDGTKHPGLTPSCQPVLVMEGGEPQCPPEGRSQPWEGSPTLLCGGGGAEGRAPQGCPFPSRPPTGYGNCPGMATRVRTAAVWVSRGFSLVSEKLSLNAAVCRLPWLPRVMKML